MLAQNVAVMGSTKDKDRVSRLIERARHLFLAIADERELQLQWDETAPVELAAWLRRQPGLDWDLFLNLQNNDEIGIQHDYFYVEWFPADDPAQEEKFVETLKGLLSGDVQLRCSFQPKMDRPYRVDFQREVHGAWSTFYYYADGLHVGRPASVTVMRNGHGTTVER